MAIIIWYKIVTEYLWKERRKDEGKGKELKLTVLLKVKVWVTQSCPTLCDLTDCTPPGFSVHGILQARILEQVAIPFSKRSSWFRDQTQVSYTAGRFLTIWATRETQLAHCCCLVSMSYQTLWDPMDWSLPGSSVHGNSPGRILDWLDISSSN